MIEIKAPNKPLYDLNLPRIFLAGSIEEGKAQAWQQEVVAYLKDTDCVIFNPRRDHWDISWEQSIDNPQFNEQVTWELDSIDQADVVMFYFDPKTKSPISLMELGICAASQKTVLVCCPEGFYRKGNVDILCDRYEGLVTLYDTLDELLGDLEDEMNCAANNR